MVGLFIKYKYVILLYISKLLKCFYVFILVEWNLIICDEWLNVIGIYVFKIIFVFSCIGGYNKIVIEWY